MTQRVVITADAKADLRHVKTWYDIHAGMGDAFVDEVHRVLDTLQLFPRRGLMVQDPVRQAILRRFPYKISYFVDGAAIIVVALTHRARGDEPWKERMR